MNRALYLSFSTLFSMAQKDGRIVQLFEAVNLNQAGKHDKIRTILNIGRFEVPGEAG